jgi:hypothetical protein
MSEVETFNKRARYNYPAGPIEFDGNLRTAGSASHVPAGLVDQCSFTVSGRLCYVTYHWTWTGAGTTVEDDLVVFSLPLTPNWGDVTGAVEMPIFNVVHDTNLTYATNTTHVHGVALDETFLCGISCIGSALETVGVVASTTGPAAGKLDFTAVGYLNLTGVYPILTEEEVAAY